MRTIDLRDYAYSSRKLSSEELTHASLNKHSSRWSIWGACLYDIFTAASAIATIHALLDLEISGYIISKSLLIGFHQVGDGRFMVVSCLILVAYYFFSFYFNAGQTYGMNVFKNRIDMPVMSLSTSLKCSILLTANFFTFGIALLLLVDWMQARGWGTFVRHDHLYLELMEDKIFQPVSLLYWTKVAPASEDYPEDFYEAA